MSEGKGKLTENDEDNDKPADPDYMCLTHGQTVPLAPESCEYEGDVEACRYAWVDLTPISEPEAFLAARWGYSLREG